MNKKFVSLALCTAMALGVGAAQASEPSPAEQAVSSTQQLIADTTQRLEKAFAEQFVKGQIDPAALAGPINDVVQAMPQASREQVQTHINDVLAHGQKLATEMTPEQRTVVATAPAKEEVGSTKQGIIGAWGWPGAMGWGGFGAFGFPGMGLGWGAPGVGGWGSGLGYGLGLGWGAPGLGLGWGTGFGWNRGFVW
jgi:hypothetical protein